MPLSPLIVFDLNPIFGVVTAGYADDIRSSTAPEGGAAAMERHGFTHDPALSIYRQHPDTLRIEQLRNTALATGELSDLGYGVAANQRLLTAYSALAQNNEPAEHLTADTSPADAGRLLHEIFEHPAGQFAQLRRFIDAVRAWMAHHDTDTAHETVQRLTAAADILTSLGIVIVGNSADISRLPERSPHAQTAPEHAPGQGTPPDPAGPPQDSSGRHR